MAHPRLVTSIVLCLAAAGALGLATPAAASGAGLPEGDFVATYSGTMTSANAGGPSRTRPAVLELTCRAGTCTFVDTTSMSKKRSAPMPQGPTVSQRVVKRVDPFAVGRERCPEFRQTFTDVFTASAAAATYSGTAPAVKMKCADGSFASGGRWSLEFQGTLTDLAQDARGEGDEGNDEAESGGAVAGDGPRAGSGTASSSDEGADAITTTSRLESRAASAPSVLSALPTVGDVSLGAGRGVALALLVVILVLLIAFPTHLLNSAVESGQDRLSALRRRRLGLPEDAGDAPPSASARTWGVAAGVVLAASVISAFVDPGFGLNPGSARVIASLGLALAIETLLVWSLVIGVTRRASPGTIAGFHAAPATLLVVALAVLLTRLTGFEPGIIFGLVAGVTFATAAGATAQGKVALAGTGLALVLALGGWIGYSLIGPASVGSGFARTFLTETLSSLAIAGIASLPLALVPLRGMTGHTLYTWSRPLWAGSYAVGLLGFFLVLMPMPFSWSAVDTPLRVWVLLYVAYAATAVVAWAALTRPWHRDTAPTAA